MSRRRRPASFASTESGEAIRRAHEDSASGLRGEFQRDRDRVIHCAAFRRLEYKTQVFVNHEGDMFRTRLTHSIEVAQIGRTVARAIGLNEDLTEAICLAHDLGHTPFGHAGQDALNTCMRGKGGFEHNLQSLRIVDLLEEKYAAFPGLNLTFATREGILKHCAKRNARSLGALGRRFLDGTQPSLEAQLANICDEIAYNNHDVDDGLRAGLLDLDALAGTALVREALAGVREEWPDLGGRRVIHEMVRRMIDAQVRDLLSATEAELERHAPHQVDDVRALGRPLVGFSDAMREKHLELKRYLREHLYQHYRVHRMATKARGVVRALFEAFANDSRLLPEDVRERVHAARSEAGTRSAERAAARVVADYIAGMTDRYAIAEHQRLVDPAALS